ncbi:MAG TPA: succinyl-diaminopimelate desuccinylase [Candidatus Limnocylindria bacterium]|nr:succinyl-diaminopimelate desuccinylase [Candidatus Limnocylindria bacterium]
MITADLLSDLLETLVNIPSETGREAAIADWVAARLATLRHGRTLRSGHSLVWRSPSRPGRPLLVLAGHLDTVPAHGNALARREGERLFGVGASDMKAGDAVMLALLEGLDPDSLRFDLAAVFYDAEEGPAEHNGLKRLLDEIAWLRSARLAILLEPTDLRVELGCNGVMNVEVRAAGKSAHSARPWLGTNAVAEGATWLAEITRFPTTPVLVQGIEFHETLQVTTLHAGRARNVIPDELVANLNYRFPPERTLEDAERRVRALIPAAFEARVVDRAAPGQVCLDLPEVGEFVTRFGAQVTGKQGWTDVARFTAAGIPAFNFGPGLPEQAHQVGEYCPLPNLERAHRWLSVFLKGTAS